MPITAGAITETAHANTSLSFTATAWTGGTAPYTYQWARRLTGVGLYVNIAGATTLSPFTDTGLTPSTGYDYQLTGTDSATPTPASASATLLDAVTDGPFSSASTGTEEWGNGTVTNLSGGNISVLCGPTQCYDRKSFNQVWFVQGTGAFNLDYQYTPDQGANWYIGKQVDSSTTTVDGGAAGYTQEARFAVQPGYQYRIQVYNSGSSAINLTYDHRYVGKH